MEIEIADSATEMETNFAQMLLDKPEQIRISIHRKRTDIDPELGFFIL
jgi:hypothetical protein